MVDVFHFHFSFSFMPDLFGFFFFYPRRRDGLAVLVISKKEAPRFGSRSKQTLTVNVGSVKALNNDCIPKIKICLIQQL